MHKNTQSKMKNLLNIELEGLETLMDLFKAVFAFAILAAIVMCIYDKGHESGKRRGAAEKSAQPDWSRSEVKETGDSYVVTIPKSNKRV